jgi:cytoskeletal protein RodZ
MQWKKVTILCQGVAACALWACGLPILQCRVQAQTSDQTQADKTSKPKRSRKSTATDATSSQATVPAEASGAASKAKKAKASTLDATSSNSANRAQIGEEKPSAKAPVKNASAAEIQSAKAAGDVWVNTGSGVYHKGGQWFGATKQGKFMTEQDAIKAGYKAAKNEK